MAFVKKFLVSLACSVILALCFGFACSPATFAKQRLSVWHWTAHATEAWRNWLDYVKKTFEERHPDVEVRFEFVEFGASKLLVAIAGGAVPDVTVASVAYARDIFESGGLMSLNSYIKAANSTPLDQMFPATQFFNRVGDDVFGMTNSLEASVIVYNVDLFEEAGLNPDPMAMATWSDFISYAKKLTKRGPDGQVVRAGYMEASPTEAFASWLYSNGGAYYNDSLTRAAFNTRQGLEALNFMRDLLHVHKVSMPGSPYSAIASSKAAMVYWETAISTLQDTAPDLNFRMTSFPVGPSGKGRGSVAWGNMYVIPKGARHPDLAWEYMLHYLSISSQVQQIKLLRIPFSPRKDFYATDAWKEAVKSSPWMATIPQIFSVSGVYPFRKGSVIDPKIMPLVRGVLDFKMAAEEALSKMEQVVNQELGKK